MAGSLEGGEIGAGGIKEIEVAGGEVRASRGKRCGVATKGVRGGELKEDSLVL